MASASPAVAEVAGRSELLGDGISPENITRRPQREGREEWGTGFKDGKQLQDQSEIQNQ